MIWGYPYLWKPLFESTRMSVACVHKKGDWSRFDRTTLSSEIRCASKILDNILTFRDSAIWKVWKMIKHRFSHSRFETPDGLMSFVQFMVPSGSMLTCIMTASSMWWGFDSYNWLYISEAIALQDPRRRLDLSHWALAHLFCPSRCGIASTFLGRWLEYVGSWVPFHRVWIHRDIK